MAVKTENWILAPFSWSVSAANMAPNILQYSFLIKFQIFLTGIFLLPMHHRMSLDFNSTCWCINRLSIYRLKINYINHFGLSSSSTARSLGELVVLYLIVTSIYMKKHHTLPTYVYIKCTKFKRCKSDRYDVTCILTSKGLPLRLTFSAECDEDQRFSFLPISGHCCSQFPFASAV